MNVHTTASLINHLHATYPFCGIKLQLVQLS